MRASIVGDEAPRSATHRGRKRPFRVGTVVRRIRERVRPLPKAAMFALAEGGHRELFQQLVACILSIRTRDEVSLVAARRLFAAAPTPAALAALPVDRVDRLVGDTTFHTGKARQIREIARAAEREYGGKLPCDETVLRSFPGVGPKCANLVLGIACDKPDAGGGIPVDIHVHRVTNRWGYVAANTPEKTMAALMAKLPKRWWIEINRLLVPFGKHVCTGVRPKCSTCPVLAYCRQVGVTEHR
jgi:endonuclease-3